MIKNKYGCVYSLKFQMVKNVIPIKDNIVYILLILKIIIIITNKKRMHRLIHITE